MAGDYKSLHIRFEGDTSGINSALSDIDSSARKTQRNLNAVQRALKFNPGNATLLRQQMEGYSQKIQQTQRRLETLKRAESEIGRANMGEEKWEQVQREIAMCESELTRYSAKLLEIDTLMRSANSPMVKMGQNLQDIGTRYTNATEGVRRFGDAYSRTVTTGMAAGAGLAVKAAVDIDTALTGVRKTVDGTEAEYEALKDAAIEFSQTNAVSAAEVLNIQALGAQLGYSKDELQGFAEVVSGLDIATDMDAETAATNLAQFANITKMAHEDTERYASSIVELGNNLATTESKISDMSMRTAAAGTQVGMTQQQILGWSGAMASLGIEAEAGGTAFSDFVSEIDAAVASGSDGLQAYASVAGMSAEEFSTAWKNSSSDTLQSLLTGLEGADNMSLALESMGVTGVRQADVLKRLAGNTELVGDALQYANTGWSENSALSNEVANRNDSLAAKFEILKNRLVAVATEVGEPIADAMLEAVDAAQPLFEMIERGAEAFSDMSEQVQQAALKAAAAVASLGPLLSMAGRLGAPITAAGKAMESLGKHCASIDAKAAQGVGSIGKLGGKLSSLTGLSASASMGLAGLAAGLIAVNVALAVKAYQDYENHIKNLDVALNGLEGSTAGAASAMASGTDEMRSNIQGLKSDVDDLLESTANMVEGWKGQWTDLAASSTELDGYVSTIEELAGQSGLTATQQNELANAVAGYNAITGDSVEVTDAANGALSKSTDEIQKNADAWYDNARAQAYQQQVSDLIKEQIKLQDELTTAQEEYNKQIELRDQQAEGSLEWTMYNEQAKDAKKAVDELTGALESNKAAQDEYSAAAAVADSALHDYITSNAELTGVLDESGLSAAEFSDYLTHMGENVDSFSGKAPAMQNAMVLAFESISGAAETLGVSTDSLAASLEGAGISSESLAAAGSTAFAAIYSSCDGNMSLVKQKLDEYNALPLEDKQSYLEANADPAMMASAEATDAIESIPASHDTNVKAQDNASSRARGVKSAVNSIPTSHSTSLKAKDEGSGIISSFKNLISGIPSHKTVTLSAARNASGGIAIPRHADGGFGVATSPTLTTAGWVGEDGWEAIVPLSNRRYVRPFAQAVAAEVNSAMGGGGQVTNVYVNGAKVNDDAAIEDSFYTFMTTLSRKAAMNRG